MQLLSQGLLIALEGIDGSGKTTLTHHLYHMLQQTYQTLQTKEPGGTNLGTVLRTILQDKHVHHGSKSEYLLFAADRAQHFEEIIIPALRNNHLIISDRMSDSSVVYQGYGRKLEISMIQTINAWAMNSYKPDLTIYVRINPERAYERMVQRGRLTGLEQTQLPLMQQLVHGFDELYKDRHDVYTVDGSLPIAQVTDYTYNYIRTWIEPYHLLTH